MADIDFVVTWVDSSDSEWIRKKKFYEDKSSISLSDSAEDEANLACRYRELGFLKYWFRAVETCAPWVNQIYFVTCGQKPDWLNDSHPKLNLINHSDFIPSQYLPTFNSNTIELNLHRIKTLSEHFVLFNDDMLLLRPITPSFFFRDDNPVLVSNLRYPHLPHANTINRIKCNNYIILNHHFFTKACILNNWKKWFNVKELGFKRVRRNLACYLANGTIPVGMFGHVAIPHLKSTFEEAWQEESKIFDETSNYQFRNDCQINHWLLSAWNLAKGQFFPTLESKIGRHFDISTENLLSITETIRNRTVPQICINDSRFNTNVDYCSSRIIEALEFIFPIKSDFEKY